MFPWNSVGRFSSDRVDGADHLYVTNSTEIHPIIYLDGRLSLDEGWFAPYAIAGEDQGYAWDSSIGDDCAWFMDMGEIGAWRYEGPGRFTPLWRHNWHSTSQLTLYADTGELIVDHLPEFGRWEAVVVDIETGVECSRVETGCLRSAGMWYTPGFDRDFSTSTPLGRIARVSVG